MPEPVIDCEEATAKEMAAAVVSYIEEHGWMRGDLGYGTGPVCLVGALGALCAGDPQKGYKVCRPFVSGAAGDVPVAKGLFRLALALENDAAILPSRSASLVYPASAGQAIDDNAIIRFNDQIASSQDEALAPFRRVAGLDNNTEEAVDA